MNRARKKLYRKILRPVYFIIAKTYEDKKQYDVAATFYRKAIGKRGSRSAEKNYHYGRVLYRLGEYEESGKQLELAIKNAKRPNDEYLLRYAESLIKLRKYVEAEDSLRRAISINGRRAAHHYVLGVLLCLQKKWWQAEEALITAKKLGYSSAKFYRRLGRASYEMRRYDEASRYFEIAANKWKRTFENQITRAELYYMSGLSAELSEKKKRQSIELYEKALMNDTLYESSKYGISVFHESRQFYDKALDAVERDLKNDRYCKSDILYKKGELLAKVGDIREAAKSIEESIELDFTNPERHAFLASLYFTLKKYKKSYQSFENAIHRTANFNEEFYRKYTHSLIKAGEVQKATEVLDFVELIKEANGLDGLSDKSPISIVKSYAAMYEELPIKGKSILYESFHGKSIGDNPAAIMQKLIKRKDFVDFTHIFVLNDSDSIPEDLRHKKQLVFIPRDSFSYAYYLSNCKYLINNSTFPWWFIRKEGQQYLNTWHGVPWKTLGRDIKTSFLEYDNTQRNFLQATHMISPNKHTTWSLVERYDVADLYSGKIAEIGYPRIDLTLNMSDRHKKNIKSALGIDCDKKVVFYAPTWRGVLGEVADQTKQLARDIESLSKLSCELIFRGHTISSKNDDEIISKYAASDKFSTNELLAITDILITDYSSVAFDFMATGKPIVYYLYDYEDYKKNRGLYFEHTELPGEKAFDLQELIKAVHSNLKTSSYTPDRNYKNAKKRFCPNEDGRASNRVIDFFFFGNDKYCVQQSNKNKNILFYAGPFMPNGITSSAVNLLNSIDNDKLNKNIIVDSKAIRPHKDRIENFSKLKNDTRVIARVGEMVLTQKESQLIKAYNEMPNNSDNSYHEISKVYEREMIRLIGDAEVDSLINFEGYSKLYAILFGIKNNKASNKVIYLHNDLYSEYTNKYNYLELVFAQYKNYEKLISVSKYTSDLNKRSLSKKFKVPVGKFDYIENVQDPDFVLNSSALSLCKTDESNYFSKNTITFINIARLSSEKDQEKLIRAFKRIKIANPNTKLIILGDGPLRHRLNELIKLLGLQKSVHLLGRKPNPYTYLLRSDCFVLSSNYEGQPVVLYEALTLKKPIIATDIVANRAVLEGGYGELCENSEDGLVAAMNKFIDGRLKYKEFDIEKYNKRALKLFYEKALGEKTNDTNN